MYEHLCELDRQLLWYWRNREREKKNHNHHLYPRVSQPEDDLDDDDDETEADTAIPRPKKVVRLSDYAYKSKLERLIQEMVTIRDEEPPASKTLIFSQFTSTIDWLRQELPKYGFQFRSFAGDMAMSRRAKALNDFQNDPPTRRCFFSCRCEPGGGGYNPFERAENRVSLLKPCFNPVSRTTRHPLDEYGDSAKHAQ